MQTIRSRLPVIPLVTMALIIILVGIFIAQQFLMPDQCNTATYPALCAGTQLIAVNTFVGFFISPFLHGSWLHLGLNIGMIGLFGSIVEHLRGRLEYGILLFVSGYLSLETQLLAELLMNGTVPVVMGISGAGYALAGFVASYYLVDRMQRNVDRSGEGDHDGREVQAEFGVVSVLVVAYAVAPLFASVPTGDSGQTAVFTHVIGTLIGIVWGLAAKAG